MKSPVPWLSKRVWHTSTVSEKGVIGEQKHHVTPLIGVKSHQLPMFKALKKPIYRGYNIYTVTLYITITGRGFLVSCWGLYEKHIHTCSKPSFLDTFSINLQFPANVMVFVFHKRYLCRELLTLSDPTGKGQKEKFIDANIPGAWGICEVRNEGECFWETLRILHPPMQGFESV